MQSLWQAVRFPCQQWLAMARIKEPADCPHCLGSIPESRFDGSLATLGVPRSKFSSIHARCSRTALDMHEFMLQCYYQIRGRNAERLQVDKAMQTSTPLGGTIRLSPCNVISR